MLSNWWQELRSSFILWDDRSLVYLNTPFFILGLNSLLSASTSRFFCAYFHHLHSILPSISAPFYFHFSFLISLKLWLLQLLRLQSLLHFILFLLVCLQYLYQLCTWLSTCHFCFHATPFKVYFDRSLFACIAPTSMLVDNTLHLSKISSLNVFAWNST